MTLALRLATLALGAAVLSVAHPQPATTPQTHRSSALALEEKGDLGAAESEWRAYLKLHPEDPAPYAHLGLIEARQEHYKDAIPLYRQALRLNANLPGLRLNLGLALFKSGDLRAALAEFNILMRTASPDSADAQRLRILEGMAHYGLGEYAAAAPFLKAAAAREPQSLPLRMSLAHSCLWSKQYQCVMDTYREILALNAESAEADMLAGEALDEMKDTTGALAQFRAAEKANPKEPNVHFGAGYLLWTESSFTEAAAEFQLELENDPKHAQSLLYLGDTKLQLRLPQEARPLLLQAIQLDPSLWLAYFDLGIMDSDAGRNDQALQELTTAAKLEPKEVGVHWRLGRLYRTMGNQTAAAKEFAKIQTLHKRAHEDLLKKMSPPQNR